MRMCDCPAGVSPVSGSLKCFWDMFQVPGVSSSVSSHTSDFLSIMPFSRYLLFLLPSQA